MAATQSNQSSANHIATDDLGRPLILFGSGVPTNGQKGIAGGALYLRISDSSPALYQNTGTSTSTTWTQIT